MLTSAAERVVMHEALVTLALVAPHSVATHAVVLTVMSVVTAFRQTLVDVDARLSVAREAVVAATRVRRLQVDARRVHVTVVLNGTEVGI